MADSGNIEVDKNEGTVIIRVNPKIYSMDVVYSASHAFTRNSYVLLDMDDKGSIVIELKPFERQNLENLGREFCNRLLSYQLYRNRAKENEAVRNLIIYRALAANSAIKIKEKKKAGNKKNDRKK